MTSVLWMRGGASKRVGSAWAAWLGTGGGVWVKACPGLRASSWSKVVVDVGLVEATQ